MPSPRTLTSLCCTALIVLLLGWPIHASAQALSEVLLDANQSRLGTNEVGSLVLMGWAGANIVAGAVGWSQTEARGGWRGFHQMNAGWGVINLGIGALTYMGAVGEDPASFGFAQTLAESVSVQKILMFNTALDVAYMVAGGYLWERGLRTQREQFVGFGQSVLLQGAFLFVFDLALVLTHQGHYERLMLRVSPLIEGGAGGVAQLGFVF